MNKKNIFGTLAVAAMAAMTMTSCDKSKSQTDDKPVAAQTAPTDTKVAFVEVDSIMSQYKFCKDYSLILQKKGQNIHAFIRSGRADICSESLCSKNGIYNFC